MTKTIFILFLRGHEYALLDVFCFENMMAVLKHKTSVKILLGIGNRSKGLSVNWYTPPSLKKPSKCSYPCNYYKTNNYLDYTHPIN